MEQIINNNNNNDGSNSNDTLNKSLGKSEEVKNDFSTKESRIINRLEYVSKNTDLKCYIQESKNDEFKTILKSEIIRRKDWFMEQTFNMVGLFTENEWKFMMDSFNGNYIPVESEECYSIPYNVCSSLSDSIEFRNLDVKWGISKEILFKKIYQLPECTPVLNVIKIIDYWWTNGSPIGIDFISHVTDEEKCINKDRFDKLRIILGDDSPKYTGNNLNINNVKL
jgi:hypothetical protein